MSQRTQHVPRTRSLSGRATDDRAIEPGAAVAALDDPDCRAILEAASEDARTAQELIERCDVPRSTTYRKIDRLVEAGLLEERVRISTDGAHASEYRRTVEDVVLSISPDGSLEIDITRQSPDTETE